VGKKKSSAYGGGSSGNDKGKETVVVEWIGHPPFHHENALRPLASLLTTTPPNETATVEH